MTINKIIYALLTLAILSTLSYFSSTSYDGYPPNTLEKKGWTLTLNDEFEGNQLNEKIWIDEYFPGRFINAIKAKYELKNGTIRIHNGSIQTYNTHNLHKEYYSPSEQVKKINNFSQLYGYYEIRAKHSSTAHHIAFWALEARPGGSEIDITEDRAWGGPNWHQWDSKTPFPEKRNKIREYDSITTASQRSDQFNIYALEVFPTGARIYHNNILIEEAQIDWKKRNEVPLMFLLGIYENRQNGQPYEIDYFRAYIKNRVEPTKKD